MPLISDVQDSARSYDMNGWAQIKGNPISKVGVFEYSGSQISPELDPNKIYQVYRPEEELSDPETIESFKLLPLTDEHAMLGNAKDGLTTAENKGVHGVIGQDVYFDEGYLKANIKIFSNKLADLIESGKKELSIGYRCLYDLVSGVYNGVKYDAIQRKIRGNHLALVEEGRSGPDVSVLDHFKFTFDTKGIQMPDNDIQGTVADEEVGEMTLQDCVKLLKELSDKVNLLNPDATPALLEDEADPAMFVTKAEFNEDEKENDEDDKKSDGDKDKPKSESMDTKSILKEISQRNDLANKLAKHIGTFDHAEKTLEEVAQYGVSKLGLSCPKGHEQSVLAGYLAAAKTNFVSTAQDSVTPVYSQLEKYIAGGK